MNADAGEHTLLLGVKFFYGCLVSHHGSSQRWSARSECDIRVAGCPLNRVYLHTCTTYQVYQTFPLHVLRPGTVFVTEYFFFVLPVFSRERSSFRTINNYGHN